MYAVIKTGGKQYRVQEGDVVFVEKLDLAVGETVDFDVLLYQDEQALKVGTPLVEGAKVSGRIVGHGKNPKVTVFKYKAKKNIRVKTGHRQLYTKVEITSISA